MSVPCKAELPGSVLTALRQDAAHGFADVAVVDVAGSGAIQCLHGLVSCDLAGSPAGSLLYAALLTAKGMIQCDMWIERGEADVTLIVPRVGLQRLLDVLQRYVPPRLARFTERPERAIIRIVGPRSLERAATAGFIIPEAAKFVRQHERVAGRPPVGEPFSLQINCHADERVRISESLAAAGVEPHGEEGLELARVLAGWPRLGAEIDSKTLPQEVRLDELGAVSYSKGCYLGQETVARLHFRGHANRHLLGLRWDLPSDTESSEIAFRGREVGRVTSVVVIGNELRLGLGLLRREIVAGGVVHAAGTPATTVDLPFEELS